MKWTGLDSLRSALLSDTNVATGPNIHNLSITSRIKPPDHAQDGEAMVIMTTGCQNLVDVDLDDYISIQRDS